MKNTPDRVRDDTTTPIGRTARAATSDDELLARARRGDAEAYGELWRRHAGPGRAIARRFAAYDEADDLVAEAFARILSTMQRGGGPISGFRPYLITTIRNVARRWAEKPRNIQVDDFDQFEDPATVEDPAIAALDRTLTLTAFRSLPERWQTVLWYSEVEGMDPQDIAPFLGMTPNATAALAYRARAGLRAAWLKAHVASESTSPECRWTTARLTGYVANKLGKRERQAVADHLATCTECTIIAGELDHVGARLAFVLLPILVGTSVGAALLATLEHGGGIAATSAAAPPTVVPPASAPTVAAGGMSTAGWVVGGILAVGLVGGGAVLANLPHDHHHPTATAAGHSASAVTPEATPSPTPTAVATPIAVTPVVREPPVRAPRPRTTPVPSPSPTPTPTAPPDTTAPAAPLVTSTIDNDALVPPTVTGTAEPGASVTLRDGQGTLLATVTADATGAWTSGELDALDPTNAELSVVQVDAAGNASQATIIDGIAMRPHITSPADGTVFTLGEDVPIGLQAWAGSTLQVILDGSVVAVGDADHATIGADGNGTVTVHNAGAGDHVIGFRYVSSAGLSTAEVTVAFTVALTNAP
jgi:RNA polymerase sigma factor (sigma-70 family)